MLDMNIHTINDPTKCLLLFLLSYLDFYSSSSPPDSVGSVPMRGAVLDSRGVRDDNWTRLSYGIGNAAVTSRLQNAR